MPKPKDELMYEGKYLSIYKKDGWYEYVRDRGGEIIGVLVFTKDKRGNLDKILGRYEYDVQTGEQKLTSITGGVEEGQTPIECAIIEMGEESGYDVVEEDLIELGTMQPAKSEDTVIYLYGFDATGMEDMRREDSIGDGTKGEEDAYCDWVGWQDMVNMDNPVNHVAVLRLGQDVAQNLFD